MMERPLDCPLSDQAMRSAASSSGGRLEAAAPAAEHSWEERAAKALTTGAEWYRSWLFEEGREQRDEDGKLTRRGLDPKTIEKVKKEGGKLSRPQLLRCRVRYFTDGVAIGSKSFIEEVFNARRSHFGPRRKDGARPIKEADSGLCSLRDLRVQAVE